jgi:acyl-ACP thioesterase
MAELLAYLQRAVDDQASDLFIVAGGPVSEKLDGHLVAISDEKLLPDAYARFKHNFSDEDKVCSYAVHTSDIDIGRHMNNVAYLRMLCDSFSVDEMDLMNPSEMEIMYLSPCFEGDVLDIMRRKTDFGYEFGVRRADGRYAALAQIKA